MLSFLMGPLFFPFSMLGCCWCWRARLFFLTTTTMAMTQKFLLDSIDNTNNPWSAAIPVVYTDRAEIMKEWIEKELRPTEDSKTPMFVGLDVESVPIVPWRTQPFEGPCTLQLATATSCLVASIRTSSSGSIPADVIQVLEKPLTDSCVILCGVSLDTDLAEVYEYFTATAGASSSSDYNNRFDMGGIHAIKPQQPQSLKSITDRVLGIALKKSKNLARSDWTQQPLTKAQIQYAARDAWAAAAVMTHLAQSTPQTFAPSALLGGNNNEMLMRDVVHRMQERKVLRNEIKSLQGTGKNKKPVTALSAPHQKRVRALLADMRKESLRLPEPRLFSAPTASDKAVSHKKRKL